MKLFKISLFTLIMGSLNYNTVAYSQSVENGTFYNIKQGNGAIYSRSDNSISPVWVHKPVNSSTRLQWKFIFKNSVNGTKYYNIANKNTGLCIYSRKDEKISVIFQHPCNDSRRLQYKLEKLDNGKFRIVNRVTGKALYNRKDGEIEQLFEHTPNDSSRLQWTLNKVR